MRRTSVLATSLLACFVLVAGCGSPAAEESTSAAAVVDPAPSDFYLAPSGGASTGPGTFIRSDQIDSAPDDVAAWRILYRSGEDRDALSGLVVTSNDPAPAGGFPAIVVAPDATGVGSCAISFDPFTEGSPGWAYGPMVVNLARSGYAVILADVPTASSVLDAVHASQQSFTRLNTSSIALWGQGAGGAAVLDAASRSHDGEIVGVVTLDPGESTEASAGECSPPRGSPEAAPESSEITAPVLVLQSGAADSGTVARTASQLCQTGTVVDYQRLPDSESGDLQYDSLQIQVDWISRRFAGMETSGNCNS